MKFHAIAIAFVGLAALGPSTTIVAADDKKPNFIVMQPDDLHFLEYWNPPAHFDNDSNAITVPASSLIPNLQSLKDDGVQMMQAHAASPMCGTSRYSTITGRYASRSSYGRSLDSRRNSEKRTVTIPRTKLEDVSGVEDGNDCSAGNAAAVFQQNGYRTGVVGKWHLSESDRNANTFIYTDLQDEVRQCGFDYAEALYPENLSSGWTSQYENVNHNMEHVASRAIQFMDESINDFEEPFFLYVNPTVPHGSGDVEEALTSGDCRDTVEGPLDNPPEIWYSSINGYTDDCGGYRQSVLDRYECNVNNCDKEYGTIWIDDAIGWILNALTDMDQLDNTFFLFQMDHGEEGKGSLFEQGSRIVQFVHYPAMYNSNTIFGGMVSTINVVPTMLEIADIDESSNGWYKMDGKSWAHAILGDSETQAEWKERCLFFENGLERAVKCGCTKLISMPMDGGNDGTRAVANANGLVVNDEGEDHLYDVCNESGDWIFSPGTNPEADGVELLQNNGALVDELNEMIECHLTKTSPYLTPNYDHECTGSQEEEEEEEEEETCVDAEFVVVSNRRRGDVQRDCSWIARRQLCDNYATSCCASCADQTA